jgi:hypothetical protein
MFAKIGTLVVQGDVFTYRVSTYLFSLLVKIIISIVKIIFCDKNDSKFKIFTIKGLKIMNCPKEF